MSIDYTEIGNIILTRKASEPLDILWKNMGVITTHFAFTRFFIFILGIFLMIFLSSPAVMLSRLQKFDPTHFLTFDWTAHAGTLGMYLHKSLPPLIVLMINIMVISLLDYTCIIESYDSHSAY